MTQDELIDQLAAALRGEPLVRGLILASSFGRGDADAYSDVDFIAIVAAAQHEAVAALWRDALARITPIVFWNQLALRGILVNAIDRDWLRCDLLIMAPDALQGRTQDGLRVLFDHDGLHAALPAHHALPRARALAARVGVAWPTDFEDATRRRLGPLGVTW